MENNVNVINGATQEQKFYTDFGQCVQEGNVVETPQLMTSNSGSVYAYLKIAVKKGFRQDEAGNKTENTEFWEFSCSGDTAKAAATLEKGKKVRVDYYLSIIKGQPTGQVDANGKQTYTADTHRLTARNFAYVVFAPKAQTAPQGQAQQMPTQNVGQWTQPVNQMPVQNQMPPQMTPVQPVNQMPVQNQMPPQMTQAQTMPTQAAPQMQSAPVQQYVPAQQPNFQGNFAGQLPFNN